MSSVWIVSLALAWVVIGLLSAAVVTLLRQVAELRAGIPAPPAGGPPAPAPRLYDDVQPVELTALGARAAPVMIGGEQELASLLVFHVPGCSSCDGVEQWLEALAERRGDVRVVSVIGLRGRAAREHVRALGPRHSVAVAAADVPPAIVPDALPALVAIAREGVVAAVGAPETERHLYEAADVAAGAVLIGGPDSVRETEWGVAVPAWDVPALDIVRIVPDEPPEPRA
jgi:hypothetical protein